MYWLCIMLGQDDRGFSAMFRVDHTTVPGLSIDMAGWEDNEDRPRTANELVDAFARTWEVVEACLGKWSLSDLEVPVTRKDAFGRMVAVTPGWVISRLMSHEFHHGSEIALILRVHGLPTAIAG
jgi:hypothetical protein